LLAYRAHDEIAGRTLELDLRPDIRTVDVDDQVEHDDNGEGNQNPCELRSGIARRIDGPLSGPAPVTKDE
jgi:hypothetical protein